MQRRQSLHGRFTGYKFCDTTILRGHKDEDDTDISATLDNLESKEGGLQHSDLQYGEIQESYERSKSLISVLWRVYII